MAMDAVMIARLADHLSKSLPDARIDKINMPAKDEVVIQLRTRTRPLRLLLSVRSGSARVHLTEETFDNPQTPPSFCMLLRKYIGTSRITGVRAADNERILLIDFESLNELGDLVPITVSVELMGRYTNLVLVDRDNRVIDALKRVDFEQSQVRQLMPGLPFTMPPVQDKLFFSGADATVLTAAVCACAKPLSQALLSVISGIGPVVCRQIAWLADPSDPDADRLSDPEQQNLRRVLEQVQLAAAGRGQQYTMVLGEDGRPIEYSFIALTQYENMRLVSFEDPSEMLDAFYAQRDREERMRVRSAGLIKKIQTIIDRTVRKNETRREEAENSKKADEKRLLGELIYTNLSSLEKGMKSAELQNYYTGEFQIVPLDIAKTPTQNAQGYYREYRKMTSAARILQDLIADGERELIWLQSVLYAATQARSEEDFIQLSRELHAEGYLRSFKLKSGKAPKKTNDVQRYRSTNGLPILSGRNNAANERLTLRTADKNDWWFHVKNAPGSHVVLLCDARQPQDSDLEQAAMIAALHSSLADSPHIEIDYTQVRYVKKPPGSRPGMVLYERYKTIIVSADAALAATLSE